jgi:hypothetical protein
VGRDHGGYYHPFFLRGRPDLCKHIARTRIKGNWIKPAPSSETEPNFYEMEYCSESGPTEFRFPAQSNFQDIVSAAGPMGGDMARAISHFERGDMHASVTAPAVRNVAMGSSLNHPIPQHLQIGYNTMPSGSIHMQVPEPTPIHPRGFIPQRTSTGMTISVADAHFDARIRSLEDISEQKVDLSAPSHTSADHYHNSSSDEMDDDIILLLRAGAHLKED